jgi:hypothetical protein
VAREGEGINVYRVWGGKSDERDHSEDPSIEGWDVLPILSPLRLYMALSSVISNAMGTVFARHSYDDNTGEFYERLFRHCNFHLD